MRTADAQKIRWIAFIVTFIFSLTAFISAPQLANAAGKEYLNVDFGGTFTPQNGYTTGGDEIVSGGALSWSGENAPAKADGGGVNLAGGPAGITYTANSSFGTAAVEKDLSPNLNT
ncbi:hypothetical protein RQN30_08845 [Arcanobacterium hippocoleae]